MSKSRLKDILKYFWPLFILIILLLLNFLFFYLNQGENLQKTIAFLINFTPANIKNYLLSFGMFAPVALILLLIAESLVAPFPGHILIIVSGMLYGTFWGTFLVFIGNFTGAVLCFKLSERFGRPLLEKIMSEQDLKAIDNFVQKKRGFLAFLLIRLNPIMAFDIISYGAGLTKMNFKLYLIATGISIFVGGLLYSHIGTEIINGNIVPIFILSFVLVGLLIAIPILMKKIKD